MENKKWSWLGITLTVALFGVSVVFLILQRFDFWAFLSYVSSLISLFSSGSIYINNISISVKGNSKISFINTLLILVLILLVLILLCQSCEKPIAKIKMTGDPFPFKNIDTKTVLTTNDKIYFYTSTGNMNQIVSVDIKTQKKLGSFSLLNGTFKKVIHLEQSSTSHIVIHTSSELIILDTSLSFVTSKKVSNSTLHPVNNEDIFAIVSSDIIRLFEFDGQNIHTISKISMPSSTKINHSKNVLFFEMYNEKCDHCVCGILDNGYPFKINLTTALNKNHEFWIQLPLTIKLNISDIKTEPTYDKTLNCFKCGIDAIYFGESILRYEMQNTNEFKSETNIGFTSGSHKKEVTHTPIFAGYFEYPPSDLIFFSTDFGKVFAFHKWNKQLTEVFHSPHKRFISTIISESNIFVSTTTGEILKLSKFTGNEIPLDHKLELLAITKLEGVDEIHLETSRHDPKKDHLIAYTSNIIRFYSLTETAD